jgi:hypothetical protein
VGLLEILPAKIRVFEASDEPTPQSDQPITGRSQDQAPVREREEPALDGPGLQCLVAHEDRFQFRQYRAQSGTGFKT